MASKYSQGEYVPKNVEKYIGTYPIKFRSSWEYELMKTFDNHPNVVGWASESVSIKYKNPLTGYWSNYVPDFLVVYIDRKGNKHAEMIEVKPAKEDPRYKGKVSKKTKLIQTVNHAKWAAAAAYCAKNGLYFRVMTENDMFS